MTDNCVKYNKLMLEDNICWCTLPYHKYSYTQKYLFLFSAIFRLNYKWETELTFYLYIDKISCLDINIMRKI